MFRSIVSISVSVPHLLGWTSRLRSVIVSDRVDKRHRSWHKQIARSSVAPVVLFEVDDCATVPLFLILLIFRLDDGWCLDGALLEELEAFAALQMMLAQARSCTL